MTKVAEDAERQAGSDSGGEDRNGEGLVHSDITARFEMARTFASGTPFRGSKDGESCTMV
jgi:hypothetical protein